jgi:hypothetical protein
MSKFRVSFYKTVPNASGHSSKHLQKQVDLSSDSPSGALVEAERLFDRDDLTADRVEVVHISSASHSECDADHRPNLMQERTGPSVGWFEG